TITIDIVDDVPTAIAPQNAYLVNTTTNALTGLLDVDGQVEDNFGADGAGSVLFSDTLNGASALDADGDPLTSGGLSIIYSVSEDGQTLTASTLAGEVFTIDLTVNDSGQDTYHINMSGTVDGGDSTIDFNSGDYDFTGGNGAWAGFNTVTKVGNDYFNVEDDSNDLLLTPINAGSVNTTAQTGGVGNAFIGHLQGMRVDFVVDLVGNPQGTPYSVLANQDHTFDKHYTVNGASATFTSCSDASVTITAFDDDDSGVNSNKVGDGSQEIITVIGISYGGEMQQVTSIVAGLDTGYTVILDGNTFTVTFNSNGSATVDGVAEGTIISSYTANGYNSIEYVNSAAGDDFQIGDFGTTAIEPGEEVAFSVPVEIVDGDGDVASSSLDVLLLPEGTQDYSSESAGVTVAASDVSPDIIGSDYDDILTGNADSNILIGNEGSDTISGDGGDDLLIGGAGDDILTGGLGADVFAWNLGDEGSSTTPAEDTVTDFTTGIFGTDVNADKLDLSDLLSGMQDGEDLSSYIQASTVGADTILHISTSGALGESDTSAADQTITLEGVDMNGADSAAFLQSLISDGQLDIE
ncbi:calcium-binding protein, partial [Halomonas salina]|uniref:calcium-binding protein n=1 Tax=Halomonas salina TaxID=42565 RepID=UPI00126865A5